jgi:hypothetical protein
MKDDFELSFTAQPVRVEGHALRPALRQGSSSVLMRVMNAAMTRGLWTTPSTLHLAQIGGCQALPGPCIARQWRIWTTFSATDPRWNSISATSSRSSPSYSKRRLRSSITRPPGAPSVARSWASSDTGSQARGVVVDSRKVAAVWDWPPPTSNVELRQFVGLGNNYRHFVDRYTGIAAPLTRLCRPHAPWHWGPAERESLDTLTVKRCLTTAPVLRTLDPTRRSLRPTPGRWRSWPFSRNRTMRAPLRGTIILWPTRAASSP